MTFNENQRQKLCDLIQQSLYNAKLISGYPLVDSMYFDMDDWELPDI